MQPGPAQTRKQLTGDNAAGPRHTRGHPGSPGDMHSAPRGPWRAPRQGRLRMGMAWLSAWGCGVSGRLCRVTAGPHSPLSPPSSSDCPSVGTLQIDAGPWAARAAVRLRPFLPWHPPHTARGLVRDWHGQQPWRALRGSGCVSDISSHAPLRALGVSPPPGTDPNSTPSARALHTELRWQ